MNLYKAEIHRFARRRLSLIFGICGFAGLLLFSAVLAFNSQTGPTEAERAEAREMADNLNADYDRCAEDEEFFEDPEHVWVSEEPHFDDMTHEEICAELFPAQAQEEDFLYVYTFHFENEGTGIISGIAVLVGLLAMLLASSVVGAEWSSGGMANLLVWHPARMRVWGAKLAAGLTVCAAAVVAVVALAFVLLYLVAALRGETGTLDAAWWQDALGRLTRSLALAMGMTVLGSSLAMLGRHTAIAGGVIAGYLVVGDLLVRLAGFALNVKFPNRFSLYTWVDAWISGRVTLRDWSGRFEETMTLTATDAGLLLGGIVLVFTALATWSFARRDAS
ncbi:ABC transporter permease subunit [Glycomyces xiaoerkulensis]|uniref:ABC transporter permease subunit n=1 Tax=Glycomyces xiaoerkulensis TaxID=2038139 RepID=UPI000C2628D7|nr:ABC transporter permease subunit [Glycomyces xiaoerkulensis]